MEPNIENQVLMQVERKVEHEIRQPSADQIDGQSRLPLSSPSRFERLSTPVFTDVWATVRDQVWTQVFQGTTT